MKKFLNKSHILFTIMKNKMAESLISIEHTDGPMVRTGLNYYIHPIEDKNFFISLRKEP